MQRKAALRLLEPNRSRNSGSFCIFLLDSMNNFYKNSSITRLALSNTKINSRVI